MSQRDPNVSQRDPNVSPSDPNVSERDPNVVAFFFVKPSTVCKNPVICLISCDFSAHFCSHLGYFLVDLFMRHFLYYLSFPEGLIEYLFW